MNTARHFASRCLACLALTACGTLALADSHADGEKKKEPAASSAPTTSGTTARPAGREGNLFIKSRAAAGVDFSAYKTFAWIPVDESLNNPILYEEPRLAGWIKSGTEAALNKQGLTETKYGDADVALAYTVSTREVAIIKKHRFRGWSHGYNRSSLPRWKEVSQVVDMEEGTIIVDVIDIDLDRVVWTGRVAGVVEQTKTSKIKKGVRAAVGEMMQKFPPQP